MKLRELFDAAELNSVKVDTYFDVYERLFERFVGKGITFVEVGVGNGGALLMWKAYFKNARIIGVDIDPGALEMTRHGVEIFIGDQASDDFWEKFYRVVGPIDVLLDDGAHRNLAQVVTAAQALRHIRDRGVLLVEDVGTSYLAEYGNPSRYSFINFAKHLVDGVNSRYRDAPWKGKYREYSGVVLSLEFHDCMVAIHVDRERARESFLVENRGAMRAATPETAPKSLRGKLRFIKRIPVAGRVAVWLLQLWDAAAANRRLARYFR